MCFSDKQVTTRPHRRHHLFHGLQHVLGVFHKRKHVHPAKGKKETCAGEWRRRRQQITACLHQNVKKSWSRATTEEFNSAASGIHEHRGKKGKPNLGQQILFHTQIKIRSRSDRLLLRPCRIPHPKPHFSIIQSSCKTEQTHCTLSQ